MSLWLGEQFATDLAHCFKHLNVRTVSANKLLGLSGQQQLGDVAEFHYSNKESNFHEKESLGLTFMSRFQHTPIHQNPSEIIRAICAIFCGGQYLLVMLYRFSCGQSPDCGNWAKIAFMY